MRKSESNNYSIDMVFLCMTNAQKSIWIANCLNNSQNFLLYVVANEQHTMQQLHSCNWKLFMLSAKETHLSYLMTHPHVACLSTVGMQLRP